MTPFDAKARAEKIFRDVCYGHSDTVLRGDAPECVRIIAAALAEARASADELFFLDVDCELGSGCRKDRTCSGASHWLTAVQIRTEARAEAFEEAADIAFEFDGGSIQPKYDWVSTKAGIGLFLRALAAKGEK